MQNSIVSDYIVVVQRRSFEAAGFLLPSTVLLSRSWLTAQACELLLFSIIVNCHHDDQHPFSFLWRLTLFVEFLLLWQLFLAHIIETTFFFIHLLILAQQMVLFHKLSNWVILHDLVHIRVIFHGFMELNWCWAECIDLH